MAIILDEEKKRVNWFSMVILIVFIAIVGFLISYVFFVTPSYIDKIILPSNLEKTKKISEAKIDVVEIVGDPVFRTLEQHVNRPSSGKSGRVNPLAPF